MTASVQIFKAATVAGDSAFFNFNDVPNVNYNPINPTPGSLPLLGSPFNRCEGHPEDFYFFMAGVMGTAVVKIFVSGDPNPDPTKVTFVDLGLTLALGFSALKQIKFTWMKGNIATPDGTTNLNLWALN